VGVWSLLASSVPLLWALIIALVISGVGSFFLLNHQRQALAMRVQTRAERMTQRIDEMRASEDQES
jgi:CHASE1-domain containing sensor protein